jgi:hypothetical protein
MKPKIQYRLLKAGEIIEATDEVDACADGWRDDPVWRPASCVGERAPDPRYPSHRIYRRRIVPLLHDAQCCDCGKVTATCATEVDGARICLPCLNWRLKGGNDER